MSNPKRYLFNKDRPCRLYSLDLANPEAKSLSLTVFDRELDLFYPETTIEFYSAPDVIMTYEDGDNNSGEWCRYARWIFKNFEPQKTNEDLDGTYTYRCLFSECTGGWFALNDPEMYRDVPMGKFAGLTPEQIEKRKAKRFLLRHSPNKKVRMESNHRDAIRQQLELSVHYFSQGEYEAAEITTRQALKLARQHLVTDDDHRAMDLYHEAQRYLNGENFQNAMPLVRAAYQFKPDDRNIFLAYLRCCWCLGRYEEFWTAHEDRRMFVDNVIAYERIYGHKSMWNGNDSLDLKRVLIYGEGGAGDQIQFIRYIPLLKQRFNCRVILNCTASLGLLFSELDFVDEIVYKEHVSRDHKPDCDYHFPLMSLPLYLKQWEPVWTGSLFNTHRRKPRLDTEKTKVGFVFTPNPNTFEAPDNVVNVAWINHCNIPGVQFYNLHHKDRANLPGVIDLCDQIENFADLADYVNVMDVIVGIDSAILHLAGALQKKAFGLIRKNANWRWGTAERTPWYPTVRLIRQKIQGDWGTAIDDLCRYLSNTSMSNGLEK